MQSRKVGVLLGGLSSERDVSLRSGEAVLAALRERGHDAVPIYVDRELDGRSPELGGGDPKAPRGIDVALRRAQVEVAFIAGHGRRGEDGCIQGLLELLGIPYTGSDVLASALAMHKAKAKELFRLHNVPTPAYYTLTGPAHSGSGGGPGDDLADIHGDFGFPCVVKPMREASSVGVAICTAPAGFAAAVARALCDGDEVLVERFVAGKQISVAILGDRALGAVEVASTRGATEYFVPPRVSPERYRGILAHALRAHLALGCRGATRVDLIVSDAGNELVLEVDTRPGLTPRSLVAKIADAAGISFGELCEMMLAGASLATRRGRGERRLAQRAFVGADRRVAVVEHH